jgi:hypothetical protein
MSLRNTSAVLAGADRGGDEVLDHRALERIGDDQRRRGQEVGAHVGADAAFEVAVARDHRAATRPFSLIALLIGSASGPELPMQVVQP